MSPWSISREHTRCYQQATNQWGKDIFIKAYMNPVATDIKHDATIVEIWPIAYYSGRDFTLERGIGCLVLEIVVKAQLQQRLDSSKCAWRTKGRQNKRFFT